MPPWLAKLLAFLIDQVTGREHAQGFAEGVTAERQREGSAADNLQAHYDEIAAAPLSVDDAVERLRKRAAAPDNPGTGADHH